MKAPLVYFQVHNMLDKKLICIWLGLNIAWRRAEISFWTPSMTLSHRMIHSDRKSMELTRYEVVKRDGFLRNFSVEWRQETILFYGQFS